VELMMKRSIFEEGFKEIVTKVKSLFNKAARAEAKELRKVNNDIEESKRVFTLTLHECNKRSQCVTLYDELLVVVERYKELVENDPMESRAKLVKDYCDWIEKFLKEVDSKIKTLQESYELGDEYLEEGFKDILMTIKRSFTQEGRNRNQVEKVLNKNRQEMKKRVKEASLEQLKEYSENLKNSIEHNRKLLETEDNRVVKAAMQDYNKWLENLLNEVENKITKSQESFEIDVDDEYLEEGLFSKKQSADIEVNWGGGREIICAILQPDNHDDSGMLGSLTIKTPQKFLDGDDEGTSDQDLLNYVKKEIKKPLAKKGFKINNIFLH
jgi:uncharacterized protein YukE